MGLRAFGEAHAILLGLLDSTEELQATARSGVSHWGRATVGDSTRAASRSPLTVRCLPTKSHVTTHTSKGSCGLAHQMFGPSALGPASGANPGSSAVLAKDSRRAPKGGEQASSCSQAPLFPPPRSLPRTRRGRKGCSGRYGRGFVAAALALARRPGRNTARRRTPRDDPTSDGAGLYCECVSSRTHTRDGKPSSSRTRHLHV